MSALVPSLSSLPITRTSEAIFCLMKILKCAPDDPWWTKTWTRTHDDHLARAIEQVRWAIGSLRICLDLAKIFTAPDITKNVLRLLAKRDRIPLALARCSTPGVSRSLSTPALEDAKLYYKQTKTCTTALLDHVNQQPIEILYEPTSSDPDGEGSSETLRDEPNGNDEGSAPKQNGGKKYMMYLQRGFSRNSNDEGDSQ